LGIFGSLLGLGGIKNKSIEGSVFPEYYDLLNHIPMGIMILEEINKTWICLNSSSGLFSNEEGGNLQLKYDIIKNPKYRIYILLDISNEVDKNLYTILKEDHFGYFGEIYFGKSPYIIKRSDFSEYSYENISHHEGILNSIFLGEYNLVDSGWSNNSDSKFNLSFLFENTKKSINFERNISLPIGLKEDGKYVRYSDILDFRFTNKEVLIFSKNLYKINNEHVIYLFR
jgi:hypothetical protein